MWQELSLKLATLAMIFLPIATGVGVGVITRLRLERSVTQRLATVCETAALKFFLPFFVIESIANSQLSWDLALAFMCGFALPLLAFAGMSLHHRLLPAKVAAQPHFVELRLLASTYGGGNRGTALFLLLFANSAHFNDYLKWYSLVDLGNFSALMLVITVLVARQYGMPPADRGTVLRRLLGNYAVVTLGWVLLYFALRHYWPALEQVLATTAPARKFTFGTLVFLGITLRFQPGVLRHFSADLLTFLAARLFAALCLFVLLLPLLPQAWPLYLGILILALMPPSSLLPAMIGQSNAGRATLAYVNGFAGAANVIYAGLIIAAVGVSIALM